MNISENIVNGAIVGIILTLSIVEAIGPFLLIGGASIAAYRYFSY